MVQFHGGVPNKRSMADSELKEAKAALKVAEKSGNKKSIRVIKQRIARLKDKNWQKAMGKRPSLTGE